MKFKPRYSEDNPNVPPVNYAREFIRLSAKVLIVFVTLYVLLGIAAEYLALHLPLNVEKATAKSFISQLDTYQYLQTRAYVQKVLDRLTMADKTIPAFSYQVYIVDDNYVNAFAFPAGNIIIPKGLLEKIKNENELAMVLGHELGHYVHRDYLRGMGRWLVLVGLGGLLGLSGDLPGFIIPSVQVFDLQFSRDQEAAADEFGLDLIQRCYGHVAGATGVFEILKNESKNKPQSLEFFSSHPDSLWRKQRIIELAKQKEYSYQAKDLTVIPIPGSLPFENVLPAGKNIEDQ